MKFVLCAVSAAILGLATSVQGYVLEGQSWPADSVLVLQLSLGNPLLPLLDGSTSYNEAVAPAGIQAVGVSTLQDALEQLFERH